MVWNNPNIILYHGTTTEHIASIEKCIDCLKGELDEDFGQGFYTTTLLRQAQEWAGLRSLGTKWNPAVFKFDIPRDLLATLECLFFVRGDADATDYWTVIDHCRNHQGSNRGSGWYDLAAGPLSISTERKKTKPGYDQISFHSKRATALLDAHKQLLK
jgi:hypothetical protein